MPDNAPASPQEDEKSERWGPLTAAFFFLTLSAAMPAFVHVLYVVGRWSWRLVG